ncbi:hypothetical protein JVU11DRAFT_12763 [Chiua virens]|nr:hypothetical protein JVU11DRAFT_12763 [Chiua virens]
MTSNAAVSSQLWRPDADQRRPPLISGEVYRPDILAVIERSIDALRPELRSLSDKIQAHPELKFEEHYAHEEYTRFMETQGFEVQRHYLLDTAWIATYTHGNDNSGDGKTLPVLGVNSEMDALPGIGHACGHNLIGIAGAAIACATKTAMETLDIDGKVVLLGTPGEEGGSGKVRLWEKGAYEGLDVCLMCHPAPGPPHGASLSGSLAVIQRQVDYTGHTAHAGLSPWEGQNALDAAVLAYTNIGLLRQQIKPTHRVHGVFGGQDWAPNIIPDQATMHWYVRAPTTKEAFETAARVKNCFTAAASATGCTMNISYESVRNELVQNKALGEEFTDIFRKRYGDIDYEWGIAGASTDFGNVSYLMPGLHPGFSIPTVPGGGNHTREFTCAAATDVAHETCYNVSKALAHVGMRVLTDEVFLARVKAAFEEDKRNRANPELMFEERYAHDVYTDFMGSQGWVVQKHYLLETAWVATYTHGQGGRVLGVNSEMDALPGIGHACGHNLIGIAGVAVACAAKAAMEKFNIDGKVILLGTPAEEGGFGKVRLWDKGAYEGMDVCLMCHPAPGPPYSISLSSCLALVRLQVDYTGKTAHAGLSPWEGKNALDAAVLAYTSLGLLRQQIKTTHRSHGVFGGEDWAPNVIPDNATMKWFVRAPLTKEVYETADRVKACFHAAAAATGTNVAFTSESMSNELVQNKALGDELADVVLKRYGTIDYEWGIAGASTDFGNITYLMPSLHPGFAIPTVPGGGNHTREFTAAVATDVAHEACYTVSKALAHVGMRVITDEAFSAKVKLAFEEDKKSRGF